MHAERRALGFRGPETLLEVWIDPRTQDWTLVQTYTNGTSCIIAMGEHWEDLTPAPA
ncbi:putative signal peptide protein [Sulfitobacter mediterraneus KCTC 32188]|nr:putative signal peptide protein [Sulfitobacter mediterraneus KCTC 32188]